jgi:excisionase family DNA binding protein
METLLSPKQVAVAIGVSDASLKRWCDKGLIEAMRTPGGHRKLPLANVIQFIRSTGHPLARPEVLGLPAATRRTAPTIESTVRAVAGCLQNGDAEQLRRLLFGTYLAGQTVQAICDQILGPAFELVGEAWHHGEIEIYQERRGVEICLSFLHELKLALPVPTVEAPVAIGGTLSDDRYILPTTMSELVLREIGWSAQSYGCGLPVDTMAAAIGGVRPRLCWLAVSHFESGERLIAECRQLMHAAERAGALLVFGGRALTPELRERLSMAAYCERLGDLVSLARGLTSISGQVA